MDDIDPVTRYELTVIGATADECIARGSEAAARFFAGDWDYRLTRAVATPASRATGTGAVLSVDMELTYEGVPVLVASRPPDPSTGHRH